jgi:hypothetical protein
VGWDGTSDRDGSGRALCVSNGGRKERVDGAYRKGDVCGEANHSFHVQLRLEQMWGAIRSSICLWSASALEH